MRKITGLIILILLGFMGYKAYDYYHSTYVGTTAYAYVPKKFHPNLNIRLKLQLMIALLGIPMTTN